MDSSGVGETEEDGEGEGGGGWEGRGEGEGGGEDGSTGWLMATVAVRRSRGRGSQLAHSPVEGADGPRVTLVAALAHAVIDDNRSTSRAEG